MGDEQSSKLPYSLLFAAIIVGIISGLGAVMFYILLEVFTEIFLDPTGIDFPVPAGEYVEIDLFDFDDLDLRYLILIVPSLGGIISGVLVYFFAPEAEGHGTDAVIEAFHKKRGLIRGRVPIIKTLASAVLIGSGGSAGREGPIAQIGAGFASNISHRLGFSERDREILIVAGMAAGIGSIFRAPLGGSIFGIEVLYRRDYESEALIPCVISTFVAYIIFSLLIGWRPIFGIPQYTFQPMQLPFFAALGLIAGLLARLYVRTFYFIRDIFKRWRIPNFLKPAIGGLIVGIIGFFAPQVLGTGYGWIQQMFHTGVEISIALLLLFFFAKMIATSFSIGSGGSGGVFAPSVVMGGFLGGAVGMILCELFPDIVTDPHMFIIVGMGCFFAAAAKVPLASIIMIAEMTWDYNLLAPAFLASVVAYMVSGDISIYEKQLNKKIHSPLHEGEFMFEFLSHLEVSTVAVPNIRKVDSNMTLDKLKEVFKETKRLALPVIDEDGRYVGIVRVEDLMAVNSDELCRRRVGEITRCIFTYVYPRNGLLTALHKMSRNKLLEIPVVDEKSGMPIGTVSFRDIMKLLYYRAEEFIKETNKIKKGTE